MSADLALVGGKVLTMNPLQPTASAVAIKGDRILEVGSFKAVGTRIDKNTKIIRLRGKTLIPGMIDTHIHVADFGRILSWLSLHDVHSIKEIKRRLRQFIKKTSKGKWVIGRGWNEAGFTEKRLPTLCDLDEVSPDNPVVLYHESGQICVINTMAAKLAGISKRPGATFDDSRLGEFTGILRDDSTNIVWNIIPSPNVEEVTRQAAFACEKIVEAGITSIDWIILSPIEVSVVKTLRSRNKLPLRANIVAPASLLQEISDLRLRFPNDKILRILGAEIFADGYLAAETAALFEPYSDNCDLSGNLLCSSDEMIKTALKIREAGLQLVIHAVGDKAVDSALTVFEQVVKEKNENGPRYRMEQAAVLNESLIEGIRKQGAVVSVQPRVVSSEFSVWSAERRLGRSRARWLFPLKTLVDEGVRVVAGSDCPMEQLNPMLGIQAAVLREEFPEQRLSVENALRMYTIDAAYANSEEATIGSIEVGKLADITVLSADPTSVPVNKIGEIGVEMTIISGKVAYSAR